MSEAEVAHAIERFQAAAIGADAWAGALDTLARLCGAHCGELIGLGADAAVPFNFLTGIAPEAGGEFVAVGGGDVRVNSRVRIGSRAPELTVLDETAFTTEDDGRRFPEYGEWIRRHDVPFICLSPLVRQDEMLVGLAVARGARQGLIEAEERRAYATVAPHVRAAVRTQMAVENRGLELTRDLLGAMSVAAFVCDASGRIRAQSPRAEALLSDARWLTAHGQRLRPRREAHLAPFLTALACAAAASRGSLREPPRAIVLRDPLDAGFLHLEVSAIPTQHQSFGAAVLIVARAAEARETEKAELGRLLFDLTATEATVAGQLACGRGPQAIADQMGISITTVRSHIRAIYRKAGVGAQLELAAVLSL